MLKFDNKDLALTLLSALSPYFFSQRSFASSISSASGVLFFFPYSVNGLSTLINSICAAVIPHIYSHIGTLYIPKKKYLGRIIQLWSFEIS